MKHRNIGLMLGVGLSLALLACGGSSSDNSTGVSSSSSSSATGTTLTGFAASPAGVMKNADITVCDATGTKLSTKTDTTGAYSLNIASLTAPLLIAVQDGAFTTANPTAFSGAAAIVAQPLNGVTAYAALLGSVAAGSNTANVNQLTDKIASSVATGSLGLIGSTQLINACKPSAVTQAQIDSATSSVRDLIATALTTTGVANAASFDPVTSSMKNGSVADSKALNLLASVYHSRDGYGSSTNDQLRGTQLYDRNLQALSTSNVTLDATLPAWSSYSKRIFIVGDSTVSNYGKDVAPRKGWGMVFDTQLTDTAKATTKVINVAQSGRSSRSFILEGWFKLIENNIQSGDYLLIQWGHNDEKCATAGAADLTYRCTFPGVPSLTTAAGYAADMSLQVSVEKYIALAKTKGAIPVLITSVTRINQDKLATTYVEGAFPITKTTHSTETSSTAMPVKGNYTQTLIDTATANNVALVDLDAKSIAFMNSINVGTGGANATGGWRDYHLGVSDTVTYPYYAAVSTTGNWLNADRTHFKHEGAVKNAQMVVEGIKADTTRLAGLISLLK